jgi:octaprenyl-diphosphate synthase
MEESAEITFSDTLPDKIDDYRVIVDNAIASELRRREGSPFFEPLTYALRGGKRLRSVLLLLAFQSVAGGQNIHGFRNSMRDPLPAAVAMEVIHSGSIMIDDIIDEDLTRRDIDAFHASYGLKISLLNELMLLSLVLDMAASLDHRVARVLAKALSSLGTGAFEELAVYTTKQPIGAREYINILNKKTAFLFEASAMTGALVAGARENEIDALSDYGRLLGLAYQIQDDIVDWEEEPSRSLLSFLDGKSKDEKYLQELSTSFIVEAKQRLQELKSSEAKNRLIELADSVGMHSSNRI